MVIGGFALMWFGLTLYDRISTNRWRNTKYDELVKAVLAAATPATGPPLSVDEVGAFIGAASQQPMSPAGLTRTLLALSLLTLVGVALVAPLVGNSSAAGDLLKTVVTALTTALTTVLGFYFGAKTAGDAHPGAGPPPPVAPRKPTVPGVPTRATATPGGRPGEATVSFTVPADDGGSSITGYTATASPGGFTASGTSSPITVSGLATGTDYRFTVHASNAVGNSVESPTVGPVTAP